MEKEFVPYEIAFQLKELGFDEPCFGFYENHMLKPTSYINDFNNGTNHNVDFDNVFKVILAPLYQQVFRWFREKYNYHYEIVLNKNRDLPYTYVVDTPKLYLRSPFHKTYEEAQFECLKKLIEIVKNK
jgi:hypothetical protein